MELTPAMLKRLSEPFAPQEHEVRELTRGKSRVKWLVYIKRNAIIKRMNEVFGFHWSHRIKSLERHDNHITAIINITVGSGYEQIVREGVGEATPPFNDANMGDKAAVTDALKRAFSTFSGGLYLYDAPELWTDGGYYDDKKKTTDWDLLRQREREVIGQVHKWLAGKPQQTPVLPAIQMASDHANGTTPLNPGDMSDHEQSKTSAAKIETVKTELDKDGKLFIKAGPVLLWTRAAFRELGIDVSKWDTPGVHKLPAPLQVNYTGQGKSAKLVSLDYPDVASRFDGQKAGWSETLDNG